MKTGVIRHSMKLRNMVEVFEEALSKMQELRLVRKQQQSVAEQQQRAVGGGPGGAPMYRPAAVLRESVFFLGVFCSTKREIVFNAILLNKRNGSESKANSM